MRFRIYATQECIIKFIKPHISVLARTAHTHKKRPRDANITQKIIFYARVCCYIFTAKVCVEWWCLNREQTTNTGSIQRGACDGVDCCWFVLCPLRGILHIANIPRAVYDVRFGIFMHTLAIDWIRLYRVTTARTCSS